MGWGGRDCQPRHAPSRQGRDPFLIAPVADARIHRAAFAVLDGCRPFAGLRRGAAETLLEEAREMGRVGKAPMPGDLGHLLVATALADQVGEAAAQALLADIKRDA